MPLTDKFVGVMPIRQEIEVLPADDPKDAAWDDQVIVNPMGGLSINKPFTLGWSVKETIGVGIVNTRGVTAGRKSVVIGLSSFNPKDFLKKLFGYKR